MFCRPMGNTLTVKAYCRKLAFKVHALALSCSLLEIESA